jgi:hypothetical protein
VKVLADHMPSAAKGFSVILDRPSKLTLAAESVPITIAGNDDWQYALDELIAPLQVNDTKLGP